VRAISRPVSSRDLELTSWFEDDRLRIRLEATSAGQDQTTGGFTQLSSVQAVIVGPDGKSQQTTLNQIGPGLYEAQTPASESGSYLVSVLGTDAQGGRQYVSGGANRPPGLELRRFASNRALLEEVANITGGRMLQASPGNVTGLFAREGRIESSRSIRPLWRTLLWLLLPLFLLDVAARRLTWDASAIRAWLGLSETGSAARGQASRAMAKARQKVQAVRQSAATNAAADSAGSAGSSKADAKSATSTQQATGSPKVAPGASPVAQLQRDAAKKQEDIRQAQAGKAASKGAEETSGTSRLLDAKRRARQKLEEQ